MHFLYVAKYTEDNSVILSAFTSLSSLTLLHICPATFGSEVRCAINSLKFAALPVFSYLLVVVGSVLGRQAPVSQQRASQAPEFRFPGARLSASSCMQTAQVRQRCKEPIAPQCMCGAWPTELQRTNHSSRACVQPGLAIFKQPITPMEIRRP